MASIDAKNVAKEVLETIGKGKKVVLGKIIRKNGYSKRTSEVPTTVTNTKSYQEEINPVLLRYQKELTAILDAMELKNKSSEQYRVLVEAADKVQKQIQLLSGGSTERVENLLSPEQIDALFARRAKKVIPSR